MKLFISILFFGFVLSGPLLAADSTSFFTDLSFLDELRAAETLANSSSREEFQRISSLMKDFKECSEQLMDDENNKELACKLIFLAYSMDQEINTKHLNSYFSDEFLNELQFLASIAQKSQTLTPP